MNRPGPYPFPDTDALPPDLRQEVLERRMLNVYRMIMHTPAIAPSWLSFNDALRHRTSLPGNWREVAILRVGHRYEAPYEVHHHIRLARAVGLSDDKIAATRPGADDTALSGDERQIIAFVDELLDHHGLSTESRKVALELLTTNRLVDLVLTVGFYQLVCNFLNTFGVPIEAA